MRWWDREIKFMRKWSSHAHPRGEEIYEYYPTWLEFLAACMFPVGIAVLVVMLFLS